MKAEEILLAALEKKTPAERAAYLDDACGPDAALRALVEGLLKAHEQAGSFLEQPLFEPAPTRDELPNPENPGAVIGPYKLLQQIGEGGMGTVFMAEQSHPVRRKVALKVIKSGMDSRQVIARFEAERQALAMMDHVNIARVLDAGATDSGRPYFVMELVHGVPITKYCDDNHLTPRERLELFVPVCQAIQHAHQKGIIHRDIKPSNVMITLYDGKPVPKVIDFGVAKATEQRLTERTLFTQYGTMVGTLEYMSPEQAEMSGLGVDTRSDIYSLGVLLYELLTGNTPLSHKRVREAAYGEILRLIKEEEPPKPSTRLSESGAALPSIAAQRHMEPAKLTKLVRGELDWIVMKCLEKDRNRRYETANGFAADVQRYLNDESVEACPPSAWYRFRKFARRNKRALATASVIALALVLGAAISTWQAIRATHAEGLAQERLDTAEEQRQMAEAQRQRAEASERDARTKEELARDAEQLARRRFYAAQMNLAHNAWHNAQIARVLELLNGQRPELGQEDLRGFEWHYLWRLCHSELLTLKGHTDQVSSVTFSPDGKRLASASLDGTVKVWDATTGQETLTLKGHTKRVNSVTFSPDGKRLASASLDGTVKVWNSTTGQATLTLKNHSPGKRPGELVPTDEFDEFVNWFLSVAFSPNGQRLASAWGDGTVKVWDAKTGQDSLTLKGHTKQVNGMTFSPDGKRLASASSDGTVRVWDVTTSQEILTFKGHTGAVASVAFSPDGKHLASACVDGTVKVWDAKTGQEVRTLTVLTAAVLSVAFSSDGQRLASAGGDQAVKVWDATTGQEILTLKGHTSGVNSVSFRPDGKRLASGGSDGTVTVWDAATDQEALTLKGHTDGTKHRAFSPDYKRRATVRDGTVTVWNVMTGLEIRTLKGHTEGVVRVVFSPDGQRLASVRIDSIEDGTVKVWDVTTGQETLTFRVQTNGFSSVAFSPDGQCLTSANSDGTVKVWDVTTGQEIRTLKGHTKQVDSVTFSPDGKRLASRSGETVKVWDATTGQEIFTFKGRTVGDMSVAFSPDSQRLASRSGETVKVWDATTGQETLTFRGHTHMGRVSFSPDGKRLASVCRDGTVKLWDAKTGQETLTFKGHTDGVFRVAFSPDGQRLATIGSADKTVKVWDAKTGQETLTLKVLTTLNLSVAFSPDGQRLTSASWDGTVKIWDATPRP